MDHPLTEMEQRCIAMLAEAANLYHAICMEPGDTERDSRRHMVLDHQAHDDWNEAAAHFHVLQRSIMGQAAARIFPDKYRLLGGVIADGSSRPTGRALVEESAAGSESSDSCN